MLCDLCAICAFLGRANNATPERVYARYYELQDLEGLKRMVLNDDESFENEPAVVLQPDAFQTMMRLMEVLPNVASADEVTEGLVGKRAAVQDEENEDDDEDKENVAPVILSLTVRSKV